MKRSAALDPRSWPARSVFFESIEVLNANTSRLPELGRSWSGNILETFVAFLQAYIFTLLSALFIGQRYHPEH